MRRSGFFKLFEKSLSDIMAVLKTLEGEYQDFNWSFSGLTEKEKQRVPKLFIYDNSYKSHYIISNYCLYDENQKVVYTLDYLFDRKKYKPLSHLNFKKILRLPSNHTLGYEKNLKKIKGKAYFQKTGSRSYKRNDINVTRCDLYLPLKWFKIKEVSEILVSKRAETEIYKKIWFYYQDYKFECLFYKKTIEHKKNKEIIEDLRDLGETIKIPGYVWGSFNQKKVDSVISNLKKFVKEYKNPKVEK